MNIRRKDRAVTDETEIRHLVEQAKILHLGLMDGDYPYVVPLHYGYAYSNADHAFVFYMHGAKVGHKIDLIRHSANAFVEIETNIAPISGEDDPCRYGSLYASFMGRGTVTLVEEIREKKEALYRLMLHQTGRDFAFTDQMASSVAVIKVMVTDYTAKANQVTPKDR